MENKIRSLASLTVLDRFSATLPDLISGIAALPGGGITEIFGRVSTGRTALTQMMLATATLGGEASVWIDCCDSFDPGSADFMGADLGKLFGVQCGRRLEVALKVADMVLHSGGFGLIMLDLSDASPAGLQRISVSYWYRLRVVEHMPSILLVLGADSIARSCADRQFTLERASMEWHGFAPFQTMVRIETVAISRKPMSAASSKLELFGANHGGPLK